MAACTKMVVWCRLRFPPREAMPTVNPSWRTDCLVLARVDISYWVVDDTKAGKTVCSIRGVRSTMRTYQTAEINYNELRL